MKNISKVFGIITTLALIGFTALSLTACGDGDGGGGSGGGGGAANPTYIITGSGTAFTAKKGGVTVGTAEKPIQTVIDAVKTDAAGKAVTIQFGDGTNTLDIGTAYVSFSNTTTTWGAVKLTGKIKSNVSSDSSYGTYGIIFVSNSVSVTSSADISNTNTGNYSRAIYSTGTLNITGGTVSNNGYAVYNNSTSTVTISGGNIQSSSGYAVYNYNTTGTITISGGTVSSTGGTAVRNESNGKIIVSGTAIITSGNTNPGSGVILNYGSLGTIEIKGGNVTNTSTSEGNAIFNSITGTVTMSGGTVSVTGASAIAIYNSVSGGTVTITGGTVSATGLSGYSIYNNNGTVTVGPGATIIGNKYGVTP